MQVMKKKIRGFLDFFLNKIGIQTIRTYELFYLHEKFTASVEELYNSFSETILPLPPLDARRIHLLKNLYGTTISEALYILFYLNKSMNIVGDVCEFGIANGATSTLLAYEIKKTSKTLWLFDSFRGLSKPTAKDILINDMFHLGSMDKYEGTMSYSESNVINKLATISFPSKKTNIVKGFIEDTIKNKYLPKKISFAYIDFDLYNPTVIALEYLHKHLSKGGCIVVDDYDFFSTGVKSAVDEFVEKYKKQYSLVLPHKFAGNFCIVNKK
jgi:hypothetical protein